MTLPDSPVPAVSIEDHKNLSDHDWSIIRAILAAGEAVNVASAILELPKAPVLAIARIENTIVGLGAIKRARPRYAQQQMDSAGYDFDPGINELGYIAIAYDWRGHGYSRLIVHKLLERFTGALFSTTDNDAMIHLLSERGFKRCGGGWLGNRGLNLSLWIQQTPC